MADETKPGAAAPVAVVEAENKAEEHAQVVAEEKAAVEAAKEKAAEAETKEKAAEAETEEKEAKADSESEEEKNEEEPGKKEEAKEEASAAKEDEREPPKAEEAAAPEEPVKEEAKPEEPKTEAPAEAAAKESKHETPAPEEPKTEAPAPEEAAGEAVAEEPNAEAAAEETKPAEPELEPEEKTVVGAEEEETVAAAIATGGAGAGPERRARPQKEKQGAVNCPRCNSTNTKFCYYNNYSLQQPRYFCKTCRRYWTEGGSLRNVPVCGGSRKNKRSSSAAAASTSAAMSGTVVDSVGLPGNDPKLMMHEGAQHDLNLAFPRHSGCGLQPPEFPSLESSSVCNTGTAGMVGNGSAGRGVGAISALELLRSTAGQHVQLGMPAEYVAAGLALGEFRMPPPPQSQSVLGFSLDTHGTATGGVGGAGGWLLFPFEDLKPAVSAAGGGASNGADHHQYEQSKDQAAGDGSGANGVTGGHETPDSGAIA